MPKKHRQTNSLATAVIHQIRFNNAGKSIMKTRNILPSSEPPVDMVCDLVTAITFNNTEIISEVGE
jgi:hypothetical protein